MRTVNRLQIFLYSVGLLALAACASTPQVLPIQPVLDLGAQPGRGAGRTLTLTVVDARPSKVVGYRDPNDKSTAITAAPEMLPNITSRLETAYAELGFELLAPGTPADVALEIKLVELDYRLQKYGMIRNLSTGVTFKATSTMHSKTVSGTFRDAQMKEIAVSPSLHQNAEILNAHMNAAMSKLVSDDQLTAEDP